MKISKMTILTTNTQIRKAICSLMLNPEPRRVILSGFIGAGAEMLIPNPKGVEIYCWDRAGGTNPDAVRALIEKGADVYFVRNLHAKVYWSSSQGCVIGSANLSQNGLGPSGLTEIAVQLPQGAFDMDRYLRSLKAIRVTKKNLDAFELRCAIYRGRNEGKEVNEPGKSNKQGSVKTPKFPEWFAKPSVTRREWRLEVFSDNFSVEDDQRLVAEEILDPADVGNAWYWTGTRGMTTPGRALLSVEVEGTERFKICWCFAQKQSRPANLGGILEETGAPFLAIQRAETSSFGPLPFAIDKPFRAAVKKLLREHNTWEYEPALKLAPDGKVSARHLKELLGYYKESL